MGTPIIKEHEAAYFLASIINTLQDSVVTIDLDGIITSWNPSAERLYGYPAKESVGRSLELVLKPEDFGPLRDRVEQIRNGHRVAVYDTYRLHRDGRTLRIEVTLSPVMDDQGVVIGVSTLARDVTEIRKTEEALAASESHLSAVMEAAVDFAIITIDEHGHISHWNSGAERMFGYSRQEVTGKHTNVIFTPEDQYGNMAEVEMDTARSIGRSIDERWHLRKDGSRFFASGVMTPIANAPAGSLVKIARDITDRKLAEEALMLSEHRNSLAVQSAGMGEWSWDLLYGTVNFSEQARNLFGTGEMPDTIGTNLILDHVYPADDEALRKQLAKALDGSYIFQSDFRIIRPDNQQVRWLNVYGRVVAHVGDHPSKMLGVIYDITTRKMLEKQKDDFISQASHELKTPVTAIKAYGDLLEESLSTHNVTGNRGLLAKLNGQVDRLIQLIQTLLDSSNLAEGKMRIHPRPTDLNSLVEDQINSAKAIASSHQIRTELASIGLVHADRQRIGQVVMNFLTNAIKYSPAGSEIIVSTTDEHDAVRVMVRDGGPGIPAHAIPFLFDRYYRVPGETSVKQDGFGLGLYISAEIIREHNGTIGVESVPGKGSSFHFMLPYS